MDFVNTAKEMRSLGCEDPIKCALATRVYLDLKIDKSYAEIEKYYDPSFDMLYLKAQLVDKTTAFVLPALESKEINMRDFRRKFENDEDKKLILAICDTSSTILYYKLGQLRQQSIF